MIVALGCSALIFLMIFLIFKPFQVMQNNELPSLADWRSCDSLLCPITIKQDGKIEDSGPSVTHVSGTIKLPVLPEYAKSAGQISSKGDILSGERKLTKMSGEEITPLLDILKVLYISQNTPTKMSSEISKCLARDPWSAGQNVQRSSK